MNLVILWIMYVFTILVCPEGRIAALVESSSWGARFPGDFVTHLHLTRVINTSQHTPSRESSDPPPVGVNGRSLMESVA